MRNRRSSLGSGKQPGPGRPASGKQPISVVERMRKHRAAKKKALARKPIVRTEP